MKLLVGMVLGAIGVGVAAAIASAHERSKGGVFSILLGSQVVLPNDDATLNAIEQAFGWELDTVATRYLSQSPNGTLFTVHFLPSADTPPMPSVGKVGTTPAGVPFKVVSVTKAPVA